MSVTQYPDAELQVWNNAAFDCRESVDSAAIKASWSHVDRSDESIQSDCSKENRIPSPIHIQSPVFVKSGNPLQVNNTIINTQGNGFKIVSKQDLVEERCDERKIDMEIVEIEEEISRLSSKLEALRFQKLERSVKSIEKRGKIVPAKFMEPKQSKQSTKIEEKNLLSSSKTKISNRRGLSLGPSEIYSAAKSRRQSMYLTSKKDVPTPVMSTQSRRKSCFFKLEGISEGKERGKSSSVGPKSRRTVSKIPALKTSMTTIGSKRAIRKEDGIICSIQPRKLFADSEKSAKKPIIKPGRFVASRYNQIANGTSVSCEAGKRSLPENGKAAEGNKRRASQENNRVKKRWEIPSEVVILKDDDVALPKIRTLRFVNESPRDSGAAKRVAELVGRKSFFDGGGGGEGKAKFVCQALTFEEGEEDYYEG